MIEDMLKHVQGQGYEVQNELTSGSFSRVYKISKEGELFVLKFPNPDETYVEECGEMVIVNFSSKTKHIITERDILNAVGQVDGIVEKVYSDMLHVRKSQVPYLINKYIPGETLKKGELIRGRSNIRTLHNAIDVIHNTGYAYLDIRCDNIRINSNGKPWLVDLGTGQKFEDPREFEEYKDVDLIKGKSLVCF